jgi:hypothetical protein
MLLSPRFESKYQESDLCTTLFKDPSRRFAHALLVTIVTVVTATLYDSARLCICATRLATVTFLEFACVMLVLLWLLRVPEGIQRMHGRLCLQQLFGDFNLSGIP